MDIVQRIDSLLSNKHTPVFMEFGACDGYHTNILYNTLSQNHNLVKYYAFEPVRNLYNLIISKYPNLVSSINLVNKAIGNDIGTTPLYIAKGDDYYGNSSIKEPKLITEINNGITFDKGTTEVTTLDFFCEEKDINHIDFIWANIQGSEADLIKGGTRMFSKTQYLYLAYCDVEMYGGQVGLKEILDLLPEFVIVEDYEGEILLKNNHLIS